MGLWARPRAGPATRLARPGRMGQAWSQALDVEEVIERANAQQLAGPGQGQLQHMSSPLARLFAKRGKGNTEEGVEKREERDRKSSSEGKGMEGTVRKRRQENHGKAAGSSQTGFLPKSTQQRYLI